jgi:hypothetical protein
MKATSMEIGSAEVTLRGADGFISAFAAFHVRLDQIQHTRSARADVQHFVQIGVLLLYRRKSSNLCASTIKLYGAAKEPSRPVLWVPEFLTIVKWPASDV